MAQAPTEERTYKAGDFLFEQGQPCSGLYIIRSGQIEISQKTKDKKKVLIAIAQSGHFLGELSLIRQSPHSSTAEALTDVEVIHVSLRSVENQLAQAPIWLKALLEGMAEKLYDANILLKKHRIIHEDLLIASDSARSHQKKDPYG